MKVERFQPERPERSLRERLIDASLPSHSLTLPTRSIDSFTWPAKQMKIADQNPNETFVRLVEKVADFRIAKSDTRAKNILAHCAQLGRRLNELLPGNDEGVRFFHQGLNFLEIANPELAEDVGRVIQKAWDEKRFERER